MTQLGKSTAHAGAVRSETVALRHAMVEKVTVGSWPLSDPAVLDALRTVPREIFAPECTDLSEVYDPDVAVPTRWDENEVPTSSVSSAQLQGRMIEQARLRPGDRVLEVGSGGYNAALIAEVVGETGHVVTVDIDPWVTERAARFLGEAGYADRVTVVAADAELPVPGQDGLFDAIIVTVGAWDISPAWLDRLAPEGRLVVPLRLRTGTRSIGFRRVGDHLESTNAEQCGFVAMQGIGRHDDAVVYLVDPDMNRVDLGFDPEIPAGLDLPEDLLHSEEVQVWSEVEVSQGVDFAGLLLWLASRFDGFCTVNAPPRAMGSDEPKQWFHVGAAFMDSFVFLACDQIGEENESDLKQYVFGARGYGPRTGELAGRMLDEIRAWDAAGRPEAAGIGYWPNGSDHSAIPGGAPLQRRRHSVIALFWPDRAASRRPESRPHRPVTGL